MPLYRRTPYRYRSRTWLPSKIASADTPLVAAQGAYVLTGQAALFPQVSVAAQGSYSYTGQAAVFATSPATAIGLYSLTGIAANLLQASPVGRYTLTGQNVDFAGSSGGTTNMPSDQATYVVTGRASSANISLRIR